MDDFAEHDNGQLRLEAAGEQRSLLPLPDDEIPTREPRVGDVPVSDIDAALAWRAQRPSVELCRVNGTTFYGSPDCLYSGEEA